MAMSFEEFDKMAENLTIDTLMEELRNEPLIRATIRNLNKYNVSKEEFALFMMVAGMNDPDLKMKVNYVSNMLLFEALYEKFKNEGVEENAN
jgi:hypothetical protein